MKTFKLPGYNTFNDIIPHVRNDDNKVAMQASNKKKATPKKKGKKVKDEDEVMEDDEEGAVNGETAALVPEEEVGMGGPEGRVYWPPGMEDWLRPKKREVKPKAAPGSAKKVTPAQKRKALADAVALEAAVKEQHESDEDAAGAATPATKKAKEALKQRAAAARAKSDALQNATAPPAAASAPAPATTTKSAPKRKAPAPTVKKEKEEKVEVTPPTSDDAESELELNSSEEDAPVKAPKRPARAGARSSGRANKSKVSYQEADVSMDED